jgi:glutamate N-acetyltransferase/amino-acid N-acetyltransferase
MLNIKLARDIAKDGEGATKLITCFVSGADSLYDAEVISKSVISSSLVKAAMFGEDANIGRVLCAMGYSGGNFDTAKVDISYTSSAGNIAVCKQGIGLAFDEDAAALVLAETEISIEIDLNSGDYNSYAYGCDLTYDYVKINGDYRS